MSLLPFLLVVFVAAWRVTYGEPQTFLLNDACNQYNVSSPSSAFEGDFNATFSVLRSALSNSSGGHFATAQRPLAAGGGYAVLYALLQCRPYLSRAECLACLSAGESLLRRKCGAANGARAIYDGCFLRYESGSFFDQATLPGSTAICGAAGANFAGFSSAAEDLAMDLVEAAPMAPEFFVAAERDGVFGVAQCLQVALGNIGPCLRATDGRAVDAGCFMRYSSKVFFPSNQTMDLSPFLGSGSRNKAAIIGGVVGGVGD